MITNEIMVGKHFKMKVNFNLVKKHGSEKRQIWLTATIKGDRCRVFTGERIEEQYWQKSNRTELGERAIENSQWGRVVLDENRRINKRLDAILDYCREYAKLITVENFNNKPIEFTKQTFEEFMKNKIHGIESTFEKKPEEFIRHYIEKKKTSINRTTGLQIDKGTVYNHNNALKRLLQYCTDRKKNLKWELFDKFFEDDFEEWFVIEKGYAANTLASQFSIMKVWLKVAKEDKLIENTSVNHWPTKTYDVDNIYLNEEEIERIYNLDFNSEEIKAQIDSKSKIEISRDLFVIACWTGLRFGDLTNLHKAAILIDEGILKVPTSKTDSLVAIPMHPIVKKIIEKYKGVLPHSIDKSHSLSHIRKCGELAKIDTPTVIRRIKRGKSVIYREPKYRFIMNHTGRRSFATNQFLRGIPTLTIMAITGHRTEDNFMKYIKVSREEHAKIMAKNWTKTSD